MAERTGRTPVVVVGGGLAGLAAAAVLGRAGRRVVLCERAHTPGGRATTHVERGYAWNLGAHALYRSGPGMALLRGLGITPRGGIPSQSGGFAYTRGRLETLPTGPVSLLTTGLLRLPAKLEVARLLGALPRIDASTLHGVTVQDWLERAVRRSSVRTLVEALLRLSTYMNDPARVSAGAALAQLQLALAKGVLYLDGGWQTLVESLSAAAMQAGVEIRPGVRAEAIERNHAGGMVVRAADGTRLPAAAIVLAVGPRDAAGLLAGGPGEDVVAAWERAATPVEAATLDVALGRLPRATATFALGIDRPLYLSVHSAAAKLAPGPGAVIHVMQYLPPGDATPARAIERELEGLLDLVQPGWRDVLVARRFLPSLRVSHASVLAASGGLPRRPGPAIPGVADVYVAGDWVGPEGVLADASLASAGRAAELVLASPAGVAAAA